MKIYIIRSFNLALKSDSFFNNIKNIDIIDYLYLLTNYLISRITDLLWVELFIQQALVIIPIYITLFRLFKNKNSIFLGAVIYFLFMYNLSMNIARQSIALSFEILGFSYLKKNKYKAAICIIVSILFHNTALFILVPIAIFYIFDSKQLSAKFKLFVAFSGCICCILILYFITQLLPLLSNSNLLILRRLAWNMRFLRDEVDIAVSNILLCIVCVLFTFLYRKQTVSFCYNVNFFPVLADRKYYYFFSKSFLLFFISGYFYWITVYC